MLLMWSNCNIGIDICENMSSGDRHANRYVALSIATSCNTFAARARMRLIFKNLYIGYTSAWI